MSDASNLEIDDILNESDNSVKDLDVEKVRLFLKIKGTINLKWEKIKIKHY